MTDSYAVVFPGQGSQSVGMLSALSDHYPQVKQCYEQAADALGYDLFHIVQHGPDEKLNQTEFTQPAILVASVAIWKVLQSEMDLSPAFVAGHSLGEYSALVCAGAIEFTDAVKLVALRGKYMQEAVAAGTGSMAAIVGLEDEQVVHICEQQSNDTIVSAANFNSPGQVVIAGHKQAVERAVEALKAAGAKRAIVLPVSVPSHCSLMQPAAERLGEALREIDIDTPAIPVIHNIDATPNTNQQKITDALLNQLYQPVQWTGCVKSMSDNNVTTIIECGPGKVLSGLIKRIDRSFQCLSTSEPDSLQNVVATLKGS